MTLEKSHYILLRKAIGIIAMTFYPACLLIGFLFGNGRNEPYWWQTISAQYYSNSKIIFIGAMFTMGVFFLLYKGYDWKDKLVNTICAIAMLNIIVFPGGGIMNTSAEQAALVSSGVFDIPMNISHIIHCISGAITYLMFYINIRFLFTLHNGEITEGKEKRNKWYKGLSLVFLISELIAFGVTFLNQNILQKFKYIPAVCVLVSFFVIGLAWLIKGEGIKFLNDE